MKGVDTIARIRREFFVRGKTIKEIVRELHVSRNTVRKVLRSGATEFTYEREVQPLPKLGRWKAELDRLLAANAGEAGARAADPDPGVRGAARARLRGRLRRGAALRAELAARAARRRRPTPIVPLSFAPGEAYQFDWSHEVVLINGTTVIVKVAHVRLCHSRMLFVRAYPRETPGDGVRRPRPGVRLLQGRLHARHLRQHEDGGGDDLRRQGAAYNRRFLQMCSHYPGRSGRLHAGLGLGEGAGREPGRPGARALLHAAAAGEELRRAERLAARPVRSPTPRRTAIPSSRTGRSGRCSRRSGRAWCPMPGRFDGFHAVPASVSKTCLVRFDNNRYSVAASAVGRPVEIRAYAERIEIRQDGRVVGEHPRCFGRDQTVYDPWHYVPVLARKPGALRNGAPFKDWVLPAGLERVRRKLAGAADGDRQMVDILTAVLSDGLPAVEAACAEALGEGVHSADVILNILARRREPGCRRSPS